MNVFIVLWCIIFLGACGYLWFKPEKFLYLPQKYRLLLMIAFGGALFGLGFLSKAFY